MILSIKAMAKIDKKILVVEDEKPLAAALYDKLTRAGFEVLNAKNGEEGLETALREHPDLILLDIFMPKMDGLTVLAKLHEDAWGKNAKVIMLTNLSYNKKVVDAWKLGPDDYLVKSDWKIEDIVAKVRERVGEESSS